MHTPGYEGVLRKVEELSRKYKQELQQPATSEQLADLRVRSQTQLGIEPTEDYLRLLAMHNGLDWDGLSIYSTLTSSILGFPDRIIGGFVEENLNRRATVAWRNMLIFGDTGDESYCLDLRTQRCGTVDSVSLDTIEMYEDFDDMIRAALSKRA